MNVSKGHARSGWAWIVVAAVYVVDPVAAQQPAKAPDTKRVEVADTFHGTTIPDPYRWLEDQWAPETRAWIDQQNAYTAAVLAQVPGSQIERRLSQLMKIDTFGAPFVEGGRYFFIKRAASQDLSILCMRRKPGGHDEVLVDPHTLSADHTTSVTFEDVSTDGKLLAYGVREGGQDEVSIRLMNVDARTHLRDALPKARYFGVAITASKDRIIYAKQTSEGPRVFIHRIGTDTATDAEIFGKGFGPEKIILAEISEDGRYLLISVLHGAAPTKVELYLQDLRAGSAIVPLVSDIDALFQPVFGGDRLFILTNWDAPNYRVMVADLSHASRDGWNVLIPEGKSPIDSIATAGGKLFVSYLENVQTRVDVLQPDGTRVREIAFPGIGAAGDVKGAWGRDEAFFSFSSFAQPPTIYRYVVSTGAREVWAKLNVPVNGENVDVKQVWYGSKDGTKVPMFIAHRKGLALDGLNPTLLTGYGGFMSSSMPGFSSRAAFWIESGGVYALANLRGGGEFGEAWHRAGMLERKQNVFNDFIAAAEYLVANKYTSPTKLAISGGSNGGLLVGAALTQRPDLFRAVVCSYPLLDMLRYERFLVAGYWVPEYGAATDPAQFKYLRAYSPYQNVQQGVKYPAVLFITGDGDTRVDPLHARKMAALMQASTGSEYPVLLKYDTKAGHSGGLPVSKQIADLTDEMRFLFWQLGMKTGTE